MQNVIDLIRGQPDFYSLAGARNDDIAEAEKEIGVSFARDYREYTETFGAVSANGHELTGVCNAKRLDVITVTKAARKGNVPITAQWYVLEETGVDGMTIWQASNGEIYRVSPGRDPMFLCESLEDYIEMW